jgi:LPXTG-motif cell wall-anchored protein
VTIVFPDGTIATGMVDANGNYRIAVPAGIDLKAGDQLRISVENEDGEKSDAKIVNVSKDTSPTSPVNPGPNIHNEGSNILGGGIKLPDTATNAWSIGASGLAALLMGLALKLFRRNKKPSNN